MPPPPSHLPATLAWLSCDLGPVAKKSGLSSGVFSWTVLDRATKWQRDIAAAAQEFGVSVDLLNAVAYSESRFSPHVSSPAGASGMFQFMPATWSAMLKKLGASGSPSDVPLAARAAALYLSLLLDRFDGNVTLALAGYNWGPGNASKHRDDRSRWPAETVRYTGNTIIRAEKFRQLRARCATHSSGGSPSPLPSPSPSPPRPSSPGTPPSRPPASPSSPSPGGRDAHSGGGGIAVALIAFALIGGGIGK